MHADMHACRRTVSHTSLPLFYWTYGNVSASQEMFANVRTCGWRGPRPHVHSVQLCRGLLANCCTPLVYLPLPPHPGGKLIVSIIDCHGKSALSSG